MLLLNPDTELTSGALDDLATGADRAPSGWDRRPKAHYGDGQPQPSRRRFPTFSMALFESTLLEQWFPRNRWARATVWRMCLTTGYRHVDWLTGACLLTRRAVWKQVGLLDDRFFMYSEELDWCRRAAAAGWGCLYVPEAHVIHHEGRSSGQVVARRQYLFDTSKVLYWQKHHGALRALALRWFLLLTYVVQLVEESVKWLFGHKRAMREGTHRSLSMADRDRADDASLDEETP